MCYILCFDYVELNSVKMPVKAQMINKIDALEVRK